MKINAQYIQSVIIELTKNYNDELLFYFFKSDLYNNHFTISQSYSIISYSIALLIFCFYVYLHLYLIKKY